MITTRKLLSYFIVLVGSMQLSIISFSQPVELDAQKWVLELSKKDHSVNERVRRLDSLLAHTDSTRAFQFLNELAEKGKPGNYYFMARFNCLKARIIYI